MINRLSVAVLGLVCASGAWAQMAGFGAVSGQIRDTYGDGIPDTAVTLTNPALGVRRTAITTDDGIFHLEALAPSSGYRINVRRKGFSDWESTDFVVALGETLNFKIDMQVEAISKRVEASSVLPQVENTKVGLATEIGPRQIDALPVAGRRLDSFVLLGTAVTADNATGQLAFHGVKSSDSFLTDGIDTTNAYYQARAGIANQVSPDAVEALQVLSSDYLAEFGRATGGVVNTATRSGSNNYHGSAYDYSRITGLTANDRYALGQNLLHRQDDFGANVGGPILHDKVFFFANFGLLDGHFDGLNRITNPLLADATGTHVLASNCTATAAQCAAAVKFLQPQMNVAVPFAERWLNGLAKIDYRRSDRNSFDIEANAMNLRAPDGGLLGDVAPNGGLLGLQNSSEQTRYGRLGWTSAPSDKSVNELRFGVFGDRWFDPATAPNPTTGSAEVTVAGVEVGSVHPYSTLLSEHRYQLVDNLTWSGGLHTVKFGGDLSQTRDWIGGLDNSTGLYTYPSLTAFAQDFSGSGLKSYTNFVQQLGTADRALPVRDYDLYAQDTWRVTQRLLLTVGVRWEKPILPQGQGVNTTYYMTGVVPSPDINFAPRAGVAYSLDDRTVVRAGYGWFFEPLPGQLLDALFLGNGVSTASITVNPNQVNAPAFPKVFSSTASIPSGTQNLLYATSKLRDPRTQQATVAVERRLTRDTTLTLSLLNTRGLKFWSASDTNLAVPTKTETYPIDNAAGQRVSSFTTMVWNGKVDGTKAHVYDIGNGGSSTYNAVAVEVRKRMAYGFSAQASYTWSHAIDDLSGPLLAGFVPLNTYDSSLQSDRGNSAIDQRHRATINWIWQPAVVRNHSAAARYLLNGWQVSGIATIASPQPVTPLVLVNGQQFSTITMSYTNSLDGSGGWSRVPFEGVNSLLTGAERNVDARLTRTLPFSERVKGMLMFEVFDAFNTQHTTAVNTIAYQAVTSLPVGVVSGPFNGILKPVPGLGAGIASQAFPDGTSARRCQIAFRVVF